MSAWHRRTAPDRSGDPVRITAVGAPLSDDIAARSRRYLIQMSIRVACFVGAVLIDHWTRWVLLVGAVVLPYVAVVLANAGRERGTDPGTLLSAHPPLLPGAPGRPDGRAENPDRAPTPGARPAGPPPEGRGSWT